MTTLYILIVLIAFNVLLLKCSNKEYKGKDF